MGIASSHVMASWLSRTLIRCALLFMVLVRCVHYSCYANQPFFIVLYHPPDYLLDYFLDYLLDYLIDYLDYLLDY